MKTRMAVVIFLLVLSFFPVPENSSAAPRLTFSPRNPEPGQNVRFSSSNLETNCWIWDFGDGSPRQSTKTQTTMLHSFKKAGTYRVKFWDMYCDDGGAPTVTLTVRVQSAKKKGTISFHPKKPSEGEKVSFNGQIADVSCITWDFGDGKKVKDTSPPSSSHSFEKPGTYTIRMYADCGKTESGRTKISVREINRNLTADKIRADIGETVRFLTREFQDNCVGWDYGDGRMIKGGKNESHVFPKAGRYTVRAYDYCGKRSIKPETIQIQIDDNALTVSGMDLLFDNRKKTAEVSFEEQLMGEATLQFSGRGILRYQWLVDSQAIFGIQSLNLMHGTRNITTIKTPENLPTKNAGQHKLSIVFLAPRTKVSTPEISYSVKPPSKSLAQMPDSSKTIADFDIVPGHILSAKTTLQYHLENTQAVLYHIRFAEQTFPKLLSCGFQYSQFKKLKTLKTFNPVFNKGTIDLSASPAGFVDLFLVEGKNGNVLWFLWMSGRLATGGQQKNADGSLLWKVTTANILGELGPTKITFYLNTQTADIIWQLGHLSIYNSKGALCRQDGNGTRTVIDANGAISEFPDGTTGRVNKDGSEHWGYADGSKTVIDKNGTLIHYDQNGKIVYKLSSYKSGGDDYATTDKDGGKTIYVVYKGKIFYKDFTIYPDGSIIYYDLDGQIRGYSTEGCKASIDQVGPLSVKHGNGSITYYNKDGWRDYSKHPDSSATYFTPPGSPGFSRVSYEQSSYGKKDYQRVEAREIILPDGTKQSCESFTYERDGSQTCWVMTYKFLTIHPDGSVTYYRPPFPGKWYTQHPDNSRTYYQHDHIWYTESPNHILTYYKNDQKWYRENQDGSKTYYDRDGKEWYTTFREPEKGDDRPAGLLPSSEEDDHSAEKGLFNTDLTTPTHPGATLSAEKDVLPQPELAEKIAPGIAIQKHGRLIPEHKENQDNKQPYDKDFYNDHNEKIYTRHPDGSTTYYNKDGKKWYTENSDGSITYYNRDNKKWYTVDRDGWITHHIKVLDQQRLPVAPEQTATLLKGITSRAIKGTSHITGIQSTAQSLEKLHEQPGFPLTETFLHGQGKIDRQVSYSLPVDDLVKEPHLTPVGIPQILHFSFQPAIIEKGQTTRLYYEYTGGGGHGEIEDTNDPGLSLVDFTGQEKANGSIELKPQQTIGYYMQISGKKNGIAWKWAKVVVQQLKGTWQKRHPEIITFSVKPSVIEQGDSCQFFYEYKDASDVNIYEKSTNTLLYELWGGKVGQATSGKTYPLKPDKTTTYIIKAENRNGFTTKEVNVKVLRKKSAGTLP